MIHHAARKMLLGGIFSQIGEDYDGGSNGFYVMDEREKESTSWKTFPGKET